MDCEKKKGQSREINQLLFVAKYYFEEAEKLKVRWCEHLDNRMTDIMDFFKNGIPAEKYQMELALLIAHLNSAAIRLCTINERLREEGGGEIIKNYVTEFRKKRKILENEGCWKPEFLAEELRRNIEEYLPQILRDGIAHREEAEDPPMGPLWKARHSVIELLKIIEVFTYMQSAIERVEYKLMNRKLI